MVIATDTQRIQISEGSEGESARDDVLVSVV